MQVFRLVDPGRIDRVLAFDSLPDSMLSGITKGTANGLPSNWLNYLGVKRNDKLANPFYILDFRTLNRDKEKWQEITNYVRRSTDKNFRLMDNLYDMAKPMSPDSHSSLELEPDDVLVIPILTEEEEIEEEIIEKIEKKEEKNIEPIKELPKVEVKEETPVILKKRGWPKKEAVPA